MTEPNTRESVPHLPDDSLWYERLVGFYGEWGGDLGDTLSRLRGLPDGGRSVVLVVAGVTVRAKQVDVRECVLVLDEEEIRCYGWPTGHDLVWSVPLTEVDKFAPAGTRDVRLRSTSWGRVKLTCRSRGSASALAWLLNSARRRPGRDALATERTACLRLDRDRVMHLAEFVAGRASVAFATEYLARALDGKRLSNADVAHEVRLDVDLSTLAPDEVAATLAAAIHGKGPNGPGHDVGSFWVLAATGHPLADEAEVELHVGADALTLRPPAKQRGTSVTVPFSDVVGTAIGGAGEYVIPGEVRGGGFAGGGFGVKGFVLGVTAAAALNKLTTRITDPEVRIETVLRISTNNGEIDLISFEVRPGDLDIALAPVRVAVRGAAARPAAEAADPVDLLERLVRLRDAGALTDEEFAEQKARILRGS